MSRRAGVCLGLAAVVLVGAEPRVLRPGASPAAQSTPIKASPPRLQSDLDRIFSDPLLSRAVLAARVESLRDGRLLYAQNDAKLMLPASNMKLITLAVAADRLGWDFRFETRLEATGPIADGVLHGDLVATGGGDPSIGSHDSGPAPEFVHWADQLRNAGVQRVEGRVIGDDGAFDDAGLGPGWSWDDLGAGYAAPSGALSYNENAAILRITPGRSPGDPVAIEIAPPGHGLNVVNELRTGPADSPAAVTLERIPGRAVLVARGTTPAGAPAIARNAAVDDPTRFFVEALRLALAERGIHVAGGSWDADDLPAPPASSDRRLIARAESLPLSGLAGYFMKESQNFYAETFLKALGRAAAGVGTTESGRRVVTDMLISWGVPADAFVVVDGSGLSRYNYLSAATVVTVLRRMWADDRLRGPFAASLPVAGHDGTLESRMRGTALDARVQAKTGTLSNVRALSGYLEAKSGRRLVFSIIANHFTAPTAQIDAVVERALARLSEE